MPVSANDTNFAGLGTMYQHDKHEVIIDGVMTAAIMSSDKMHDDARQGHDLDCDETPKVFPP